MMVFFRSRLRKILIWQKFSWESDFKNWTYNFNIFRANSIKIIRSISNSIFGIFNPLGLKLITRICLGLSQLYCTKKSFTLRISSVNVIKSAGNYEFSHIYSRSSSWKAPFFVQSWMTIGLIITLITIKILYAHTAWKFSRQFTFLSPMKLLW